MGVAAGHPPADSAALSEPSPFEHRRGEHCASTCLGELLAHHRLSYLADRLDEATVFGIGSGLGFNFVEAAAFDPPVLIGRSPDFERDFCRNLAIALDRRATDDPAEGWRWLRQELDAGHPTMVYADIKELDYLDVKLHNSHHDIVVVAYDLDRRCALVADHDRPELEWCTLDSLARARASTGFPGPARNTTWVMRFPAQLPPLQTVGANAVARTVSNMSHPAETVDGVSVGLPGVARFVESFPHWPEMFPNLRRALRSLHVYIARAGTGGALFRSFQARFLAVLGDLLDEPPLREGAAVYAELASAWARLAERAHGGEPGARHAELQQLVRDIGDLEHAGVNSMRAWLRERERNDATGAGTAR